MAELKNAKHEAFVAEYVKHGNGARAYRAVYGDVKGAAQSAKHVLGLDHEALTYRHGGRDLRLTDVRGDVIHGVLD